MAKGLFLQYLWSPLPTSLFTSRLPTNVNSNFLLYWCSTTVFLPLLLPSLCPVGICPPLPAAPSSLPLSYLFLGRPHPHPFSHYRSLPSPHGSFPARIGHLQGSYLPSAFTNLTFLGMTFTHEFSPPPSTHHQGELSCQ